MKGYMWDPALTLRQRLKIIAAIKGCKAPTPDVILRMFLEKREVRFTAYTGDYGDGTLTLSVKPSFFRTFTWSARKGIMAHEIGHMWDVATFTEEDRNRMRAAYGTTNGWFDPNVQYEDRPEEAFAQGFAHVFGDKPYGNAMYTLKNTDAVLLEIERIILEKTR